ncbi:protein STPG3 isoform X2 [Ascaphus truei]
MYKGSPGDMFPYIRPQKLVTWNEAMSSRPPLCVDLDGPGPTSYSPSNMGLKETPCYTFGRKTPPREGGGRTAWQTSWFQSSTPFLKKTHFETMWPSPCSYAPPSTLGPNQFSRAQHPSFTIGRRGNQQLLVSNDALNNPSPDTYNRAEAHERVLQTHPAYSLRYRTNGTVLWTNKDQTPGPGAYELEKSYSAVTPHSPSYYIQGQRGNKT